MIKVCYLHVCMNYNETHNSIELKCTNLKQKRMDLSQESIVGNSNKSSPGGERKALYDREAMPEYTR